MTHTATDAPVDPSTAVSSPSLAQARASVAPLLTGVNIIQTPEQLDEMVVAYEGEDFCFDVETVGTNRVDPIRNQVMWIAFSTHGRVDVIPLGHPNGEFVEWDKPILKSGLARMEKGQELRDQDYSRDKRKWTPVFSAPPEQLRPSDVFPALAGLFFDPQTTKVGHNIKFDMKSIAKYYDGVLLNGPVFDTMIASAVLDITERKGLADCLRRVFGFEMVKGVGAQVEVHPFIEVAKYAALDARWTWLLAQYYAEKIDADGLSHIMDLEMDLLLVLAQMELTGVRIDTEALDSLHVRLAEELDKAAGDVYRAAGVKFNIQSTHERVRLLYLPKDEGGQGLKPKVPTDGGKRKQMAGEELELTDYSSGADALEKYPTNPLAKSLKYYDDLNKLMSTYAIPYRGGTIIRSRNGKQVEEEVESKLYRGHIHAQFNQMGTETGRLSSKEPNLQQVPNPAKSVWGKEIRKLFIPLHDSDQLIVADWAQVEPRIIASLADEKPMIEAFLEQRDIYTEVAETMSVDRSAGKELVLSISYGIGPNTISQRIGCTVTEAKDLMKEFNSKFPRVEILKRKTINKARNKGYVETVLGRRRPIPLLRSRDQSQVARGERQAFNSLIQGSAGDLMKVALVTAADMLPPDAQLMLTVHDEMVVSCSQEAIEEGVGVVRHAMETIDWFKVPLVADIKVVKSWGDAK